MAHHFFDTTTYIFSGTFHIQKCNRAKVGRLLNKMYVEYLDSMQSM